MLYKQDIANLALGHLGVSQKVMDLTNENTVQAKTIRTMFRASLDRMLEKHEWGFASGFAGLALQEENPILGYSYAYALPGDCLVLRIIAMDGSFPKTKQYEKEKLKFREVYNGSGARIIYTDIPRAHGEYTVRLPEDMAFPTHFGFGLSHLLALDIAPSLVTNNFVKIKDALISTSKIEVSSAIADDLGREPQLEDSPCSFISARLV